jgi:hypothetical protein
VVSTSSTAITCNGETSTITISASGGTLPYSDTGSFVRPAGTYTFNVSDANGCQTTTSITVTQPAALIATTTATATNCPTCTDGSVSIQTVTGGTAPYQYTDLNNLGSGYYCITVTDANGCTTQACGLVNSTSCTMTANATAAPIVCNGGATSVNVVPVGGSAPYTGAGSFMQSSGTYTYVVTDVFGCFATASITLSEPSALVASSSSTDALCNGSSGSVSITASGGTAPYTGTGTYTLAAGNYNFTVTDANGCKAYTTAVVNQPAVLTASAAVTSPIACNGGTALVNVTSSGGTTPYTGTGTFTVTAGTYAYTVTDVNGCTAITSVTVAQPGALLTGVVPVNVTCHGGSNGSITAGPSGGTAPYTVTWSTGDAGNAVTSLVAGTYTVTVTDNNGCVATTPVQVSQPQPFPALGSIQGTATACLSYGVGTAVFSVAPISDGVNPTTYTWTPPAGMSILSGQGTSTVTLTWTALALDQSISGNLSVIASNSCETRNKSVELRYSTAVPVTPGSISGSAKVCSGDVVTYSVTSVPRATHYVWTLPTGMTITSGSQSNIITVAVGVAFTGGNIGVQAANACGSSPVRTRTTTLNLPLTPGVITGPSSGLCAVDTNFSIAAVSGASTYLWTLPAGAGFVSGQGTTAVRVSFTSMTSGSITVQSVNGCGTSSTRSISVSAAPARPAAINVGGSPCAGGALVSYTASTSSGATAYTWLTTTGGTIVSGQGTKTAGIQWSLASAGTSQTMTVRASNACGSSTTRALTFTVPACVRESAEISADLNMGVFPNPIDESSMIRFNNPVDGKYRLTVMDMVGRILLDEQGHLMSGFQSLPLNGVQDLPSGIYLVNLNVGDSTGIVRIVVE